MLIVLTVIAYAAPIVLAIAYVKDCIEESKKDYAYSFTN